MLKPTQAAEAERKRIVAESLTSALGQLVTPSREAVEAAIRAAEPGARLVDLDAERAVIEVPQAPLLRAVRLEPGS